jgi:hypothetical protein
MAGRYLREDFMQGKWSAKSNEGGVQRRTPGANREDAKILAFFG